MANTAKSFALQRDLKDRLKFYFAAVAEGTASDGNPTISVGAMTAGSQSAFIKIKPVALVGNNTIGSAAQEFANHVVQVVLETSTIANVALMTEINKVPLMQEIMKMGCNFELYMSANTNAPEASDITSGNLKVAISADAIWKTAGAQ